VTMGDRIPATRPRHPAKDTKDNLTTSGTGQVTADLTDTPGESAAPGSENPSTRSR